MVQAHRRRKDAPPNTPGRGMLDGHIRMAADHCAAVTDSSFSTAAGDANGHFTKQN